MPPPEQLIQGLSRVANRFRPLAAAWHAVVLAVVVAMTLLEWRPSRRTAVPLLSLPMLSVSVLSWATRNPFNGSVFALLVVLSLALAPRVPRAPATRGAAWAVALGGAALAFAWIYPHFLESRAAALYLFASPKGLIPGPTLGMVLGLGLMAGGFGSRTWLRMMGGAGLFYAVFGMFRLGVWLDAGLLVASVATVLSSFAKATAALPAAPGWEVLS